MTSVSAEIVNRALGKLQRGETFVNIAAVFVGEITANDQDGVSWWLFVTDGVGPGDVVEATISGSSGGERGMPIEPGRLERALERRSADFAVETRLQDLLANQPHAVEVGDVEIES